MAAADDGDDADATPSPLTFGDMVADVAGFDAAVAAAVAANVRVGDVQEEEHYSAAKTLFSTIPDLGEKPIQVKARRGWCGSARTRHRRWSGARHHRCSRAGHRGWSLG